MLPERFRRFLPDPQTLRQHRALRWMGPLLHHPRLWHVNRRGIAMGLAIGVFFGLLIPVVQIFFAAAAAALLMRAHIPAAVGSTPITNPISFAPVYYGSRAVDGPPRHGGRAAGGRIAHEAVCLSVVIYFAVHWAWRLRIVRALQRRKANRRTH
jgi:uncharacterized protein (DUF2062 family)